MHLKPSRYGRGQDLPETSPRVTRALREGGRRATLPAGPPTSLDRGPGGIGEVALLPCIRWEADADQEAEPEAQAEEVEHGEHDGIILPCTFLAQGFDHVGVKLALIKNEETSGFVGGMP